MRTRLALGITVAGVCALAPPPTGASGADPPNGVRLEGAFLMRGTVTLAHNVFGERRGQRLQRTWTFVPQCATGVCNRVTLRRGRSGRHILDVVTLRRRGPRLYSGTGRFWVALRCDGAVIRHGGRATEKITVRIIHTTTIGTTRLPTRVSATYKNPRRQNLTRCPGGIGRDAASYRGRRATPLPGAPAAAFSDTVDLLSSTATFTDQSQRGTNGLPIVSWSWNFGEPSSPDNVSTQPDPSHRYRLPGTYRVTLTIRDGYGQVATTARQVTV